MADSIHSYHIQVVVQLLISASVLLVVMRSAENAGLENDVTMCDNLQNQIAAEKMQDQTLSCSRCCSEHSRSPTPCYMFAAVWQLLSTLQELHNCKIFLAFSAITINCWQIGQRMPAPGQAGTHYITYVRTDGCTTQKTSSLDPSAGRVVKGKVFPYSLLSVGPGADPGVQAVSPQGEVNHAKDLAVGCRYFLPGLRLPP